MSNSKKPNTHNPDAGQVTSYETLSQAAGAMGVPKAILSLARKSNAPGFRGPRVYPAELLPWLKENQSKLEGEGATKDELQCKKLRVQIERMEFDFNVAKGEYIPTIDVDHWQTERAESLKRLLTGKIINELLPKLVGLNVPEMTSIARNYIIAIVTDFKKPIAK